MMDLARIKELLNIVAESGVAELEVEEDGVKIVVRKNAATVMMHSSAFPAYGAGYPMPMYPPVAPGYAPPSPAPSSNTASNPAPQAGASPVQNTLEEPVEEATPKNEGVLVHAPIVGTFYEAPAPDADPFVTVGDKVQPGDVLCIIEAMKLMNEIESEVVGTIREVLVRNSEPVEYDQPLFVIDPA